MTVPDRNVYAYGSIPSRTKSCTIKCYVAMAAMPVMRHNVQP